MKAEVRKQLETNSLNEGFTHFIQGGYKKPGALWVLLGVGVAVVALYWWLTSVLSARAADSWTKLYMNQAFIGSMADELKNTSAGLATELLAADQDFDRAGMQMQLDAKNAEPSYQAAAEKYAAVAGKANGIPELHLRALVGAAKSNENLGKLEEAIRFYRQAVEVAMKAKLNDHPLLLQSQASLASLDDANGGKAFYNGWPTRLPKSAANRPMEAPTPPPTPKLPDLIDPKATVPASTQPGSFVPPTATVPAATAPNPAPPSQPPAASATVLAATPPANPTSPAKVPTTTAPAK